MTVGEFMKLLDGWAQKYNRKTLTFIKRNRHMNDLTDEDIRDLQKRRKQFQRFADAILVDFLNYIGASQGVDYGMYTKDLTTKRKTAKR